MHKGTVPGQLGRKINFFIDILGGMLIIINL